MNTPDALPEHDGTVTSTSVALVRETPQRDCAPHGALRRFRMPLILASAAIVFLIVGIVPRLRASSALTAQAAAQRALTVSVVSPGHAPVSLELLLPGSVMPYADASVYARTSGYIQRWYADIGARVKAGQLLATIETPELNAQLQQARADVATARANYQYAATTSQRWQQMLQTQSVSQQDANARTADMQAKRATLASAQANVARLTEMVSYEKITAPFDGVISVRNVDVGALVTAGGTPGIAVPANELFHIAQTDVLRTFIDIPQNDASFVKVGTQVYLTTRQYPARRFPARVARSSDVIDPSSRTMRVEVDVDNKDAALRPGAYVQAHLALDTPHPALELPVSALLLRPDGVTVAVVGDNDKVALNKVTIGRDFGTYVEIATGLAASDRVINNPGDAITSGEAVQVTTPQPSPAPAPASPAGRG